MNKGQSLFELVMAIAVIALIVVALVSVMSNSVRNSTFSKNNTLASKYSEEAIEWLRGQRDSDINIFLIKISIPTPKYCLDSLSWANLNYTTCAKIPDTPFVRRVEFTSSNLGPGKMLYNAKVTVTWTDAQGSHEVNNTTEFTDWRQR